MIAILALIGGIAVTTQAMAERRVALVVGNSQYLHTSPLPNPRNDAQDMAATLRQLGFEVTVGFDLDQGGFARTIDEFARALDGADVGLFFYAGHGLQVNDKNYLVSTGAQLENAFLVSSETIELDTIIRMMESKSNTNIIFLDACRNNPLADNLKRSLIAVNRSTNLGRGLARVEPTGRDTLVAFSAAPGQEAADGRGRNSPFTAALLKRMPQPGLEVSVMLKEVANDVRAATMNAQRPQQLSDMTRTFYFAKADVPVVPIAPAPRPTTPTQDPVDLAFWQSASAANECESMRAYMRRFPDGAFSDLARIAEQRLCAARDKVAAAGTSGVTPPTAPAPPSLIPSPFEPQPNVAALTPPPAPAQSPAVAAVPAPDVARELQRELLRVGCGVGALEPDGNWNNVSRDALRSFKEHTRSVAIIDQPTPEALAVVRGTHDRVCPQSCEPGTQLRGGSCVTIEPKAEDRPRHAREREREREHERSQRRADREPAMSRHGDMYGDPGMRGPRPSPGPRPAPEANEPNTSYMYVGNKRCKAIEPPHGIPRIVCP